MGGDDTDSEATNGEGVAFGPLKRALREHHYPVTATELIEQYGAAEVEAGAATERLDAALEGSDDAHFREPREVRDAVLAALGYGDAAGEESADGVGDDWTRLP